MRTPTALCAWWTAFYLSLTFGTLAATCSMASAAPKPAFSENFVQTQTEKAAINNDAFARALFAQLSAGEDNIVVSPASVESCILMALGGARGQTASQISQALGLSAAQSADVGRLLDRYLAGQQTPHTKNPTFRLVIANSAWVQQGFPIHDAYRKLLATGGRASVDLVDFAAKTEAARQAINAWVDANTEHKIKELLAPGALDSSARLVLANAIYFKGQWATPFRKEATKNQPFHRPGAADISVPMMHKDSRFAYLETDRYQALELEYTQEGISMVVWLPRKAEGLAALEREINAASFTTSLAKLAPTSLEVFLPKFKIAQSISLGETLTSLGMKDAFTPAADFSGISDEPLMISAVVHQALVEVDEQGTEAAAATGAIAVTSAALPERVEKKVFRADHPFVFAIRKRQTGEVLFLGRVQTPAK
jgi:serpin B